VSAPAPDDRGENRVPHVEFAGVDKSYDGKNLVVRGLDLAVERGEFLTLLGPSGSGKTTCLMMLAGFEAPTAGTIRIAGRPIQDLPPHRRGIGMVFQNYALFPHMTVGGNLAFPLEVRGVEPALRRERVRQALSLVQLEGLEDRRPAQLSGGQQQRVAIARALVFEPEIVLMDEPLGALDRRLREEMQYEIRRIHSTLGVTVVYVTHDQQEAMTLSDRVAVFHNGEIEQAASPEVLYEEPEKAFVARFIGENNRLDGVVVSEEDGVCEVDIGGQKVRAMSLGLCPPGARTTVVIRPERVAVAPPDGRYRNEIETRIDDMIFLGDHLRLHMTVGGSSDFIAKIPNVVGHGAVLPGDTVRIGWAALDCRALAPEELAEGEEEW
jgi:putative spermidine/putrescine transport system ATP-binding protein